MKIHSFTVGPFSENTYLIVENRQALLIDPGFSTQSEFARMTKVLTESGTELQAVLLTHAHVDHLLGLGQVLHQFDIPVYLNHSDLYLWENFESQSAMFGIKTAGFDFTPEPLEEQEGFEIAGIRMNLLYTPGHAPDHMSFYLDSEMTLIAGDTLFRESIGRTDLYKGDFDQLASSIRTKLYTLPDETKVLPGHGPDTTIGHEKVHNGFVRA